jgi:hypothetical protein
MGKWTPPGYYRRLVAFWDDLVDSNYSPLLPKDIKCPKRDAASGVTYSSIGWLYTSNSGDYWPEIQECVPDVLVYLANHAPETWADLLNGDYVNEELETICTLVPGLRLEGGPFSPRWVQVFPKMLYIIQRMIIEIIQQTWSEHEAYIGKASHCRNIGDEYAGTRGFMIGVHGDDWIAYLALLGFASGDWSKFDLRVTGMQEVQVWRALDEVLTEKCKAWTPFWSAILRALAYIATRRRTFWCWAIIKGNLKPHISIRRLTGKVTSGDGFFVMSNNAKNKAALGTIFQKVYRRGAFKGWKAFKNVAKAYFGWVAKPSSQRLCREGFVACRTAFIEKSGWQPWPSVASVLRNWARPHYDPLEWINRVRPALAIRFRAVWETLEYLPSDRFSKTMKGVLGAADSAGVEDPWGSEYSDRELQMRYGHLLDQYRHVGFLEA